MAASRLTIRSVADADRYGIRLIHQELSLAPNLTVAENIYLGREPTRCGLLPPPDGSDAAGIGADLGLEEIRDVRRAVAT